MRVLFDQGTPKPLKNSLSAHEVRTAYQEGLGEFSNGQLLSQAEARRFDILITTDKNLRYQQRLTGRLIRILVLPTTKWPVIQGHAEKVVSAVKEMKPGEYRELIW